jgi:transposase
VNEVTIAVVLDGMDLTDAQWTILGPLLPKPRLRRDRRGRPWRDPRDVLNGILWILRTGAPWKDLPDRYPSYQTCHRRFQAWVRAGTLRRVLKTLAADLHARGGLDLSETFIDGSFASAKKKGAASAKPSAAKGPRSWPWQTALVFLSPLPSPRRRRTRPSSSRKH